MTIDTEEARITALSDADLLAEYMAGDGEPGDVVADLLAGELERRQIDFWADSPWADSTRKPVVFGGFAWVRHRFALGRFSPVLQARDPLNSRAPVRDDIVTRHQEPSHARRRHQDRS